MKICIVSSAASVHAQKWINALHDRGHEVHVITPELGSPTDIAVPPGRVYQYRRSTGILGQIAEARRVVALARAIEADITHLHSLFFVHPFFFAVCNFPGRRIKNLCVSTWGSDVVPNPPETRLSLRDRLSKRLLLSQAAAITATSAYLARETATLAGNDRVRVVPFGVDCEVFSPEKRQSHAGLRVCFVKHLSVKYGPDHLLRAFKTVSAAFPAARLSIAGGGPMKDELTTLARRLGLEDRTEFLGQIPASEVPAVLATADIFAMPSVFDSETFGVAAVEAQAMGVPVVASRVGGVPEAVRDGETGILVKPADPEALAAAIARLLGDPGLRDRMGKAARKFVAERYDFKDNVLEMEKIYTEMIDGGSQKNA